MQTALYDQFAALKARMGEYCGVETALSFLDPRAEFAALVRGCGVYDLSWRGMFRIGGKDRGRWLNGMVSNNIRELPEGHGNYNFALTPQGHIQGDLYIYNLGDHFLASTEQSQIEPLLKLFGRYIIMDQVELADASRELTAIGVQGPRARHVLGKAGLSGSLPAASELKHLTTFGGLRVLATRATDERFQSYKIWVKPDEAATVWKEVLAAGAVPAGADALEMFRVASGVPRYGVDMHERDLPQETGQTQALNFAKGCYIGQEIVERIRSRGGVHRCFRGFLVKGPAPGPGTKLQDAGKDVGELTSVASVPLLDAGDDASQVLALGYVRREASGPGTKLNAGEAQATVAMVPFVRIFSSELSDAK